ncbi:hypothetical protein [Streptomyces sp. NBC_01353]|uniref:hypothetical protein n=1 Tax=Streptomyces sp. NBC_01353 TaxID=2903835 RepID=UPI002E3033BA|nr:hypothetical protein [Streptomyces sp. NBC_01353]
MSDGAALAERIAERRAGRGDPMDMVGELRRALLLVPVDSRGLWTAELGGVRWICAFTDEASLARFARARGAQGPEPADGPEEADGPEGPAASPPWEFAELRGARLLDEIIPAMAVPAGVAVDIADPDGAMLFPPAHGIVPDAVAVDVPAEDGGV